MDDAEDPDTPAVKHGVKEFSVVIRMPQSSDR